MNLSKCILMSVALATLCALPCQAGVKSVWAVNDGEKVKKDVLDSPLAGGNSAWKEGAVTIFAARNEIVAFQVIVEADSQGAAIMQARLDELSGPGDFRIDNAKATPSGGYVGRNIEVLSEHYLHVTQPTGGRSGGWFWSAAARPKDMLGWIPDALIPLNATPGRGGLPLKINPNNNQGLWVDVYVPREAPAGNYRGVFKLAFEDGSVREIPVALEVLTFQLPDETHTKTMVYFSRENLTDRFGPGADTEKAFRQMAHRHRFDLVSGGYSLNSMNAMKGYLDGSYYTAANGYYGPGEAVGENTFSIGTYGGPVLGDTRDSWRKNSNAWVQWFTKNAPRVTYFLYITDEPPSNRFPWIKGRSSWIKTNPGPGKDLKVFVTKAPTNALEGAIDFWQGVPQHISPDAVAGEHAKGNLVGIYNGYRPAAGAVVLDEVGIGFRVFPWISRRYNLDQYFYWEATHWRQNGQGPEANRARNVYTEAITFTNGGPEESANGDGTFFYPGRDEIYPDEDRGIDGPISSIRMKNFRRGLQDMEYVFLAAQKGRGPQADAVVAHVVPVAISDAKGDVAWPQDGDSWDTARRAIADIILKE